MNKPSVKVSLQVNIDEDVVKRAKIFAKKANTSVSKMVQEYLDKTTENERVGKKHL